MKRNSRYLFPFSIWLMISGPVSAECSFCAKEVILSKALAKCYIAIAEKELKKAESTNLEFHAINLAGCVPSDAKNRAADPLPMPKRTNDVSAPATTLSFLLPPTAIPCLASLVAEEDFDPENIIKFPVMADCDE